VVAPLDETQALLLSRPYVTRLYTTMSADEMTLDPAFTFNPDLPDVSNQHTAEQIIDCDGGFRIVLNDGDTVYGETQGMWPMQQTDELPAARKILQLATQGDGEVVIDNSERIGRLLAQIAPPNAGSGGSGTAGRSGAGGRGGAGAGGSGTAGEAPPGTADDCHCSTTLGAASDGSRPSAGWLALAALAWLRLRRKRAH
jgi:MYXO-CTERM domain-containing protein